MINSVGSKRGAINELVVTNYSTAKVEKPILTQIHDL
jgi:hypothetical protein